MKIFANFNPKWGLSMQDPFFSLDDGNLCSWVDRGDGPLMIKSVTDQGDPVELSEDETLSLVKFLIHALQRMDPDEYSDIRLVTS